MQQYAGIYLLHNHSTCFGCPSHPASGVHKTVTAASCTGHSIWVILRGSFHKFRTLYVFSLKMNLFYKIHLQAFNVISIVPTEPTRLWLVLKKPLRGKRFRSIEEVSKEVIWVIRRINNEGVQTETQDLPKRWTDVIKHNGDYIEGL
jgi:hypothetical protein